MFGHAAKCLSPKCGVPKVFASPGCSRKVREDFYWKLSENCMILGQNLIIYTVVYKESESEVKKIEILQPGGKN